MRGIPHALQQYLDAAALLLHFEGESGLASRLLRVGTRPMRVETGTVATSQGKQRARRYRPTDCEAPPGLVLAHGIHPDGIDEPRFRHFARVLASSGFAVLTPQLEDLTRYRIPPSNVELIGDVARTFAAEVGRTSVGLVGVSFSGGLALLSATRQVHSPCITFVLCIGPHHDLGRVLHWFAGAAARGPEGESPPVDPHPYGIGIFVYTHLERFFGATDRPAARRALSHLLVERADEAACYLPDLSGEGRIQLERLLGRRDREPLERRVRAELADVADEVWRVSPRDKLSGLRTPVYLLHGAGDPVIPSTETRWLAREIPEPALAEVVVSAFLDHADQTTAPRFGERFRLVRLMARVLDKGRAVPSASAP